MPTIQSYGDTFTPPKTKYPYMTLPETFIYNAHNHLRRAVRAFDEGYPQIAYQRIAKARRAYASLKEWTKLCPP